MTVWRVGVCRENDGRRRDATSQQRQRRRRRVQNHQRGAVRAVAAIEEERVSHRQPERSSKDERKHLASGSPPTFDTITADQACNEQLYEEFAGYLANEYKCGAGKNKDKHLKV